MDDREVLENEPCAFCNNNTLTLTAGSMEIPYFGLVHMMNMVCSSCGYNKSDLEPEEKKDPQFWQKITDGFSSAIDASGTIVSLTIKKPVAVGTKSVIYVGSFTFTGIKTVSAKMKDGIFSGFSKIAKPFQKLKSKSYRIRQKKRK